jgi:hypothetical protein
MKLVKYGYIPSHYVERKERCKKSHRMKSCDYSFYLMSNSVVVNIYDKQAQLIALQKKYPHLDLSKRIAAAEGVIRFEIQFMYPKIHDMVTDIKSEATKPLSNLDITRILLSDEVAKDVLYSYFSRIIGFGDYYTLTRAKAEIDKKCRSTKADRLITTLELVNICRGIHKARAKLDDNVKTARESGDMDAIMIATTNVNTFVYSLRELNEMGVNPVTIPRDAGIKEIPNLLKAFLQKQN